MSFILIDDEIWMLETAADVLAAKVALRQAGLTEARVFVGDPESPETYPNGQILFAEDPPREQRGDRR